MYRMGKKVLAEVRSALAGEVGQELGRGGHRMKRERPGAVAKRSQFRRRPAWRDLAIVFAAHCTTWRPAQDVRTVLLGG